MKETEDHAEVAPALGWKFPNITSPRNRKGDYQLSASCYINLVGILESHLSAKPISQMGAFPGGI